MPYKSHAQRRKFHVLLSRGEISPETVKKYDEESRGLCLPEYVGGRKKCPARRKGKHSKSLAISLAKLMRGF